MSQAGSIQGGGGPVGPAVETLTGNSGGPVSPVLNNVFVVADTIASTIPPSGLTLVGNAVANTLTMKQNLYAVTTANAISVPLITIPMPSNSIIIGSIEVSAVRTDYAIGATAETAFTAISTGGTITIFSGQGNPTTVFLTGSQQLNGFLSITITVSGSNIIIFATNTESAGTYTWSAYVRYHIQ